MRVKGDQRRASRRTALRLGLGVVGVLTALGLASPAMAAEGSIDHVEADHGTLQVLYSVPGTDAGAPDPDLGSVQLTVNGKRLKATAKSASDNAGTVRRTAILALDVSNSMRRDGKFEEAKKAAEIFLDTTPADVYVGLVTFAGEVQVAQEPTLDRDALTSAIEGLQLSQATRLYDGVKEAVRATGTEGQRSVLVLSDGRDTSKTELTGVTDAISKADVKLDVVALAQSASDESLLRQLSDAGGGNVLSADDPEALSQVFASEAEALARQILVTADLPASAGPEGTVAVSIEAGGEEYTASAYVTLGSAAKQAAKSPAPTKLQPAPPPPGLTVTKNMMFAGLGGAAVGVLLLLLGVFGLLQRKKSETVEDRVAAYTRKGAGKRKTMAAQQAPGSQGMAAQALGVAEKALENNKGLETNLATKLEAAGMAMKPAEWLLTHAGVAFGLGLLGLLISSGGIISTVVGLALGALLPWVYLGFKRSRRVKAFKAQLADTLQLMSGSLAAGLSLAQSVDTVVREGADPIAGEFRRAIVEARLGVEIEDALESIAARMESRDFEWVVMAIRIQREVGGNLAELLNSVAATIREREYLERQVLSLSAEGRLSVWILGGLPPGFMAYLLMANRSYLEPLISTMLGWVLLGVMAVMLTVGIVWMKKLVKVDV